MQIVVQKQSQQVDRERSKTEDASQTVQRKSSSALEFLKPNSEYGVVQKKAMNNTGLPNDIKSGVEELSGISLDDVKVHYNSSKPAQMKALAYTQGTDIHVASGQEQHLGHEAWHVVQQKQGRVQPTAQMKGVNINDNYSLEREADVMGAKAVQLKSAEESSNTQWKQPQNVTVQLKSEDAPMQFWGLKQHKEITKQAFELARKSSGRGMTEKELESLESGAVFNDVHGRNLASFGISFSMHTDEFLNESHHGGMQFLHAMSNDEDAKTNKNKQMAWAKFCILTRNNQMGEDGKRFQSRNILEYIRSLGQNDILFDMLMPAMLSRHNGKKFQSWCKKNNGTQNNKLTVNINNYLINNPKACSPLAKQTVAEFFQAGNEKLDAGLIASGSLAHMLEDSFANSHAQRTINLYQQDSKAGEDDRNLVNKLNSGNAEDEILKTQTPVMLHANYNEQQALAMFGKHSKGDGFEDGGLNETQGATQAKLSVAYILKRLDEINDNGGNVANETQGLLNFIDKTLAVDNNVLALQRIQQIKDRNNGFITQKAINDILSNTDLANLGIDFKKQSVSTTKAGRQYEKTRKKIGTTSLFNGTGWISRETNKNSKQHLRQYDDLLTAEQSNSVYSPEVKSKQYFSQAIELSAGLMYAENPETKEKIKQHATEMLLNVISMQKQVNARNLQGLQPVKGKFESTKKILVNILNK